MTIIDLIKNQDADQQRSILVSASLAGAANALILLLVNVIAAAPHLANIRMFFLFALGVALYILTARNTYHRTTDLIEQALHRIKLRVIDKVERTELGELERLGTSEIYDAVSENVTVISTSAGMLANLLQSLGVLVFAALYLAWLSTAAFVVLVLLNAVGVSIYLSKETEINRYLQQAARIRLTFFDLLMDLIKGFKEVKFSRQRGHELRKDIARTSESLAQATGKANHLFDDNWILGNCVLFTLLGAMIFVLPVHAVMDGPTVGKLVAAVLFIWGPLGGLVGGLPIYVRSNQALAQIAALERSWTPPCLWPRPRPQTRVLGGVASQ